jgi:hypothetical protein
MDWILYFLYDGDSPASATAHQLIKAHGKTIVNVPVAHVNIRVEKDSPEWMAGWVESAPILYARHSNGFVCAFKGPFEILPTLRFVCSLKHIITGRQRSLTL